MPDASLQSTIMVPMLVLTVCVVFFAVIFHTITDDAMAKIQKTGRRLSKYIPLKIFASYAQ